jgi:hypothetical protein
LFWDFFWMGWNPTPGQGFQVHREKKNCFIYFSLISGFFFTFLKFTSILFLFYFFLIPVFLGISPPYFCCFSFLIISSVFSFLYFFKTLVYISCFISGFQFLYFLKCYFYLVSSFFCPLLFC